MIKKSQNKDQDQNFQIRKSMWSEVAREEEQSGHCSVGEKDAKGPGLERFPFLLKYARERA